jgi:hypothetical protein
VEVVLAHPGATWLHVSDIHFSAQSGRLAAEWMHVRDELIRDLVNRHGRYGGPDPDFIVVTGDIANTGGVRSVGEYAAAAEFLTAVGQATGVPPERCYCVPGNHDVRRDVSGRDSDVRRWLAELRSGAVSVDDALVEPQGLDRLRTRQDHYLTFASGYGTAGVTPQFEGLFWSASIACGGCRVGLAGLNTALLSVDDLDEKQLELGLTQLNQLLGGIRDCDLALVLSHHPLTWLRDGSRAAARLGGRADFHLYGHLHVGRASYTKQFGRSPLVELQAGALFEPLGTVWQPTGEYRYTFVRADVATPQMEVSVWPRLWSPPDDAFGPDTVTVGSAEHVVTETLPYRHAGRPVVGRSRLATRTPSHSGPAQGPSILARISTDLVSRLGRRRTAYPLDMSLAELHRLDLFVPSSLNRYHERDGEVGERAVAAVVAALVGGGSVLLLGEPGSGKSLSLYGVAIELQSAGKRPLPLRALDAKSLLESAEWADLGQDPLVDAVVLIDGLDEATEMASSGSLAGTLQELLQRAPALVTSRTREYEDRIAFETTAVSFDEVLVLNPWDVKVEFAEYLARLKRRGLVEDPRLYQAVVSSEHLARLVARPLYARMLTFVGQGAAAHILDAVSLYGEYLIRLGRATDFALRGAYTGWVSHSIAVWQAAAWCVYSRELPPDAIPMAVLDVVLSETWERGLTVRALNQIIDRRVLHGTEVGEFLHYSFYEYLLARHTRDRLLTDLSADEAVMLLRLDLTREIRHHLVGQLRELADDRLGNRLCDLYQQVRKSPDLNYADRLTVCNLLVYLVSRVSPSAPRKLTTLLRNERDGFMLSSILWALCHHQSDSALLRFFELLQGDMTFRAGSRGYVLYYYGDLRTGRPPFLDVPPHVPHERTSSRVLAMFESSSFQAIPSQRRYIDLYTFIDIYVVRHEAVNDRAFAVLRTAVTSLSGQGMPRQMFDQLTQMLHSISQPAVPDSPRHRCDGQTPQGDDHGRDG